MRPSLAAAGLALALATAAVSPARAGPQAEELGRCFARSTSEADRSLLVQWVFSTVALHPQVGKLATVPDAVRAELERGAARVLQDLLTKRCATETREAVRAEGPGVLQSSFNTLAQVAGRELFTHPRVAAGVLGIARHVDPLTLLELMQAR